MSTNHFLSSLTLACKNPLSKDIEDRILRVKIEQFPNVTRLWSMETDEKGITNFGNCKTMAAAPFVTCHYQAHLGMKIYLSLVSLTNFCWRVDSWVHKVQPLSKQVTLRGCGQKLHKARVDTFPGHPFAATTLGHFAASHRPATVQHRAYYDGVLCPGVAHHQVTKGSAAIVLQ